MKWVKDRTGRFPQRPHYLPQELDSECELTLTNFLKQHRGKVEYPISTDDLTILIEKLVDDLDLYADLSQEEGDVEGITDFFAGRRPKVRISQHLSSDPRVANRLRTTLTHELGHVTFHSVMFELEQSAAPLFPSPAVAISNKCKRDNILNAGQADWMEWQAGYACGAFLMPVSALRDTVRAFLEQATVVVGKFALNSPAGQDLIAKVSDMFRVSRDAARVRLLQHGILVEGALPASLFG
jgi:Zn-dependent peptidase ImmA (M78 family)